MVDSKGFQIRSVLCDVCDVCMYGRQLSFPQTPLRSWNRRCKPDVRGLCSQALRTHTLAPVAASVVHLAAHASICEKTQSWHVMQAFNEK